MDSVDLGRVSVFCGMGENRVRGVLRGNVVGCIIPAAGDWGLEERSGANRCELGYTFFSVTMGDLDDFEYEGFKCAVHRVRDLLLRRNDG